MYVLLLVLLVHIKTLPLIFVHLAKCLVQHALEELVRPVAPALFLSTFKLQQPNVYLLVTQINIKLQLPLHCVLVVILHAQLAQEVLIQNVFLAVVHFT